MLFRSFNIKYPEFERFSRGFATNQGVIKDFEPSVNIPELGWVTEKSSALTWPKFEAEKKRIKAQLKQVEKITDKKERDNALEMIRLREILDKKMSGTRRR